MLKISQEKITYEAPHISFFKRFLSNHIQLFISISVIFVISYFLNHEIIFWIILSLIFITVSMIFCLPVDKHLITKFTMTSKSFNIEYNEWFTQKNEIVPIHELKIEFIDYTYYGNLKYLAIYRNNDVVSKLDSFKYLNSPLTASERDLLVNNECPVFRGVIAEGQDGSFACLCNLHGLGLMMQDILIKAGNKYHSKENLRISEYSTEERLSGKSGEQADFSKDF